VKFLESLVGVLLTASGCTIAQSVNEPVLSAIERRCGPLSDYQQVVITEPNHLLRAGGESLEWSGHQPLSPQALAIADIIGAKDLIVQIPILEAQADRHVEGAQSQLFQVRQQLSDHILLGLLDVKSAAAEADCEEERADQLADRLQDIREKRTRRLTVFALLGSGIGSILSGGLALAAQGTAAGAIGITAGTTESSFGSLALLDKTQTDFRHERNLLGEVWDGPSEPRLMPRSVWTFLNRPLRDDPARRSLRETLIARWRQDGRLGEEGSETERQRTLLFFGQGGTYDIENLRARGAMLDLLEADINLMSHDLEMLMRELLARGSSPALMKACGGYCR